MKDVIGLATHSRAVLPREAIRGDSAKRQRLGIRAPTQESGMQLRSAPVVAVALGKRLNSLLQHPPLLRGAVQDLPF